MRSDSILRDSWICLAYSARWVLRDCQDVRLRNAPVVMASAMVTRMIAGLFIWPSLAMS